MVNSLNHALHKWVTVPIKFYYNYLVSLRSCNLKPAMNGLNLNRFSRDSNHLIVPLRSTEFLEGRNTMLSSKKVKNGSLQQMSETHLVETKAIRNTVFKVRYHNRLFASGKKGEFSNPLKANGKSHFGKKECIGGQILISALRNRITRDSFDHEVSVRAKSADTWTLRVLYISPGSRPDCKKSRTLATVGGWEKKNSCWIKKASNFCHSLSLCNMWCW